MRLWDSGGFPGLYRPDWVSYYVLYEIVLDYFLHVIALRDRLGRRRLAGQPSFKLHIRIFGIHIEHDEWLLRKWWGLEDIERKFTQRWRIIIV